MAHLIKLINPNGSKADEIKYTLNGGICCGDSYKNGKSHKFVGSEKQVEILINIINRFKLPDIILSEIEKTSFIFSSKNNRQQVFIFRLCRYIRTNNLTKILETTIELNSKNKLAIYHSFVLAHYIQALSEKRQLPVYYLSGMDLVFMQNRSISFSFKTHNEFIEYLNKCIYFQYIFYSEMCYDPTISEIRKKNPRTSQKVKEDYDLFISYIEKKQYKKAINLIKNRV